MKALTFLTAALVAVGVVLLSYIATTSSLASAPGGSARETLAPPPTVIHFVWTNENPTDTLTFPTYLAVRAARLLHQSSGSEVVLHYLHTPPGPGHWWNKTRPFVRLHQVSSEVRVFLAARPSLYNYQKSDYIRVDVLSRFGGVYLDLDVILVRPLDELVRIAHAAQRPIMAIEPDATNNFVALCNAVIINPTRGSTFLRKWQSAFEALDERAWVDSNAWYSVMWPFTEAHKEPTEVLLLTAKSFFDPPYSNLQAMFEKKLPEGILSTGSLGFHLWNRISSLSYSSIILNHSLAESCDCLWGQLVRRTLALEDWTQGK